MPDESSNRYRSLTPPTIPENARRLPAGDQATVLIAPMPRGLMRRSMSLLSTLTMSISLSPSEYDTNASLFPSGDQLPAEYRKLSASKRVESPGAAAVP